MSSIGSRIRELRMERGWSQVELSQRTGIRHVTLSRYENERMGIGLKNLKKLASAFGVPLKEIIDYKETLGPDMPGAPEIDRPNAFQLLAEVNASLQRLSLAIQELTQELRGKPSPSYPENSLFTVGDLSIDSQERRAVVRGKKVKLTPTECNLLYLLAQNRGETLPYEFLLSQVWRNKHPNPNCLKVYIQRLRGKIEENPKKPKIILTGRVGYLLAPGSSPS
jgi:transcriptional regulator with XRE-family HTH domain